MTKQEQIENMVNVMAASNDPFVDVPLEIMPQVAEALYNAGYRKVLLDIENGKAVDCVQYVQWKLIEGHTEREVKKARKETAEKIYTKIKDSFLMNSNNRYAIKLWIEEQFGLEIKE